MNVEYNKIHPLLAAFDNGDIQDIFQHKSQQLNAPLLADSDDKKPLKIYTLGRFSLVIDNAAVNFPGRAKRKPMDLLKALIALGGRDVCQDRLSEILWPDADGDAAHRSLDTTLHRLRKLLGSDKAIILREGKISLNSEVCWVDAWVFERLQGKLETLLEQLFNENMDSPDIVRLAQIFLNMYKGPFLGASSSESWAIAYRERLRSKYIRLLRKVGRYYESNSQWESALETYQRGLEIDNLIEELYQRSMSCYVNLDLRAEALQLYNTCCTALNTQLSIEPSSHTVAIYRKLLNS